MKLLFSKDWLRRKLAAQDAAGIDDNECAAGGDVEQFEGMLKALALQQAVNDTSACGSWIELQ